MIPVGVKDVTFDNASPKGTKHDHVKATVTLNAPSKLAGGTNVVIYSDSRNAVVGNLIGNGPQSTTTVVVPKDQTSATFDIATNDARLSAGAISPVSPRADDGPRTRGLWLGKPSVCPPTRLPGACSSRT